MYINGGDLRRMRLRVKITTSEAASIVGVSTRKTYENWEHNIGTPNINQLISLCQGCGVSASSFIALALKRDDLRTDLDLELIEESKPKT